MASASPKSEFKTGGSPRIASRFEPHFHHLSTCVTNTPQNVRKRRAKAGRMVRDRMAMAWFLTKKNVDFTLNMVILLWKWWILPSRGWPSKMVVQYGLWYIEYRITMYNMLTVIILKCGLANICANIMWNSLQIWNPCWMCWIYSFEYQGNGINQTWQWKVIVFLNVNIWRIIAHEYQDFMLPCEIAPLEGIFQFHWSATMLIPPTVRLPLSSFLCVGEALTTLW